MSPVAKRRKVTRNCRSTNATSNRRPLTSSNNSSCDQTQIFSNLIEIFNNSQHVTSSDQALTQLKKLYTNADFSKFEKPFMDCLRKLLQSKQTIYFRTSCEFLCKFLQHVTNLQDDRLVRSCIDVADHYMQVESEDCRLNAVFFVCKFLSHVESLDEELCKALKITLPKRIRDKKPAIRAQAVLASRKFQDNKLIQDAFLHHFGRDPELVVRKALLYTMDIDVFGHDFLVESTQDSHEALRKAAFQRIGKVPPSDLNSDQLHCILHNGLSERERQASFSFKTNTLDSWLAKLYNGLDLVKLLESFDTVKHHEDIGRLLELVHERDLDKMENNGSATKLHHVVESFRERWLNSNNKCLPNINDVNERTISVWLSLVKFCKTNQSIIKTVKVRSVRAATDDPNESIEKILDSQEQQNDEVAELYERLTPDLINLVDFLKRFVRHAEQVLKANESETEKFEYIYHKLMDFVLSYEIGDELERKAVQEDLGVILRENLLTGRFANFIPPIIKCLYRLVYSSSANLMINYISELINNVRSHLEDLVTPSQVQQQRQHHAQQQPPQGRHSIIVAPGGRPMNAPRSVKKVTISAPATKARTSLTPRETEEDIEFKIATIRIDLEELNDKMEACIKNKDFDGAKTINNQIEEKRAQLNLLHGRRYSIASDVSHMSLIVEDENVRNSTMLETPDANMDDSCSSFEGGNKMTDDVSIFKHHTNELLKCLQMYFACLENVHVTEVPQTMQNHLKFLTHECLDDWFKTNTRVRSLMIACNGITALQDQSFAKLDSTMTLLIAACYDPNSLEIRSIGFKSIADVIIEHDDLDNVPWDKLLKFLNISLRDYGKYNPKSIKRNELEFVTAIVEGTAKLFYYQKLDSPDILSHLILWWYHPRTYSRLTQFIGVFLPQFVKNSSKIRAAKKDQTMEYNWLEELLSETFVKSIEYLHDYILGPGFNIMAESDMYSLMNFLSNLVPITFHRKVLEAIEKRIDDLPKGSKDLKEYLEKSKKHLNISALSSSPLPSRIEQQQQQQHAQDNEGAEENEQSKDPALLDSDESMGNQTVVKPLLE